jgi:ribosome-binding factor A
MRDGHLEETLRRIVAQALVKDVKDPRIGFVTVSEVRLNRDHSQATVFYTVMGDEEERRRSLEGLKSSARFIRQIIGDQLRLRTVPKVYWRYDESLDRSFRLDDVLEELEDAGRVDDGDSTPRSEDEEDAGT